MISSFKNYYSHRCRDSDLWNRSVFYELLHLSFTKKLTSMLTYCIAPGFATIDVRNSTAAFDVKLLLPSWKQCQTKHHVINFSSPKALTASVRQTVMSFIIIQLVKSTVPFGWIISNYSTFFVLVLAFVCLESFKYILNSHSRWFHPILFR